MLKKVILVLIAFIAFSCSENETVTAPAVPAGDAHTISSLTKEVLAALKIDKIVKYSPKDKGYAEITKDLRNNAREARLERIERLSANGRAYSEPPIGEEGEYYEIYGASGRHARFLATSSADYYSKMYVTSSNVQHSVATFTPTYSSTGQVFAYSTLDPFGSGLYGTSNPTDTQRGWWSCVQYEYNLMCGGIYGSIMCGAAGLYAPEVVLIVYAAWMISCAY